DPAHRAHLPPRNTRHHAIHSFDKLCRSQQRILTIVHRRRPRVICKSLDGDVPPVDADDAFNYADVYLFSIENAALLNVQLEIASDLTFAPSNVSEFRRISADEFDAITNCLAAATHKVELSLSQLAVHGAAADESSFLVLKNHDFKRVTRRHVVFSECLCDFDRAQRA